MFAFPGPGRTPLSRGTGWPAIGQKEGGLRAFSKCAESQMPAAQNN